MRKFKKREKAEKEDNKKTKEKVAEALELPQELVLNIPKIILLGNKSVVVQNYKGIFLFEDDTIKVNTSSGILEVCGRKLKIIEISTDDLLIQGRIKSVGFMN